MRFAVVGGDERSAILTELLSRDGHNVRSFALEKARLCCETGCLQGCVYGADCVILPVPAEKSGLLNCPLSDESMSLSELVSALWPEQTVLGGKLPRDVCAQGQRENLYIKDFMSLPSFTMGNAVITAEGALHCRMDSGKDSLWQSKMLIVGWGRIAKILALRLMALGAKICIAARSEEGLAMAEALGCKAIFLENLAEHVGEFEYIINTVPARVTDEAVLCSAKSDTFLLELASPPGGFDRNFAENIGLRICHAPGLPGKYAPIAAAKLMQQAVYKIIAHWEE